MTNRSLLAFGALAFAGLVLLPLALLFIAQANDITAAQKQLALYQGEIAGQARLEAELSGLKAGAADALLPGANSELAAAALQGSVKQLVEGLGGRVQSAQNLPPETSGPLQKISMRYEMSVPPDKLADTIYRLETSQPAMMLDDVDMTMPEAWATEGAPNASPNMNVRWTVHAWRWGP